MLDLHFFLQIGGRRQSNAVKIVFWLWNFVVHRIARLFVVLCREPTSDVAGADAELHHHRRVADFRQLERLFDQVYDAWVVHTRIDEPHRAFHRKSVASLLNDRRAFAVILAKNDQRTADHPDRCYVRQCIGGNICADCGFPGNRAAKWIIDGGGEHGAGCGFIGTDLGMHAELRHQAL